MFVFGHFRVFREFSESDSTLYLRCSAIWEISGRTAGHGGGEISGRTAEHGGGEISGGTAEHMGGLGHAEKGFEMTFFVEDPGGGAEEG